MPITERLYYLTQELIDRNIVSPLYTDTVLRSTKVSIHLLDIEYGLELLQKEFEMPFTILLPWHNVLELPYRFDTKLTMEQIRKVDIYCTNDILSTRHAYLYTKPELDIRFAGMKKYGVNIVNSTRSDIADAVIRHMYCMQTGMKHYDFKKLQTIHDM